MPKKPAKPKPPAAFRTEPLVDIKLKARQDGSWFWRVGVYASVRRLMGRDWCEQISYRDVEGRVDNVEKEIAISAGAIAEHQGATVGSRFDPSEIARLAVETYREVVRDLERNYGASVPRRGLRG
jgi:hypothetical protein